LFLFVVFAENQLSDRFVWAGVLGDDAFQNKSCYLVSAQYDTRPTGATGDVFAAAMGYNIAGYKFPWTALGYVRGNVDLTNYSNTYDRLNVDAQAAVVAWSFTQIGEFCDSNGIEGFQPNTSDKILFYFNSDKNGLGLIPVLYDQSCGTITLNGVTGYYSSIQSRPVPPATNSNFNTTCVLFKNYAIRNGRNIGNYDFKCDVHIDYSNLWADAFAQGCPDNQRKIGLLFNIVGAAASFDLDVRVRNLNTAGTNSVNRVSFGGGVLAFTWENFHHRASSFTSVGGIKSAVTATWISTNTGTVSYKAATRAESIIFTFAQSKADGNYFYWDPTITASGVPTMASLFLVAVSFIVALL